MGKLFKLEGEPEEFFDILFELFGTSEELSNCIQAANDVVKTFVEVQLFTGLYTSEQLMIRLQKMVVLFDLLLSEGTGNAVDVRQSKSN